MPSEHCPRERGAPQNSGSDHGAGTEDLPRTGAVTPAPNRTHGLPDVLTPLQALLPAQQLAQITTLRDYTRVANHGRRGRDITPNTSLDLTGEYLAALTTAAASYRQRP